MLYVAILALFAGYLAGDFDRAAFDAQKNNRENDSKDQPETQEKTK